MQLILIFIVIAGGMGLSIEAGLLGPLGGEVGDLWATFSIFGVGAALTFLLMLFFSPRNSPSFFAQPAWQLLGGLLGTSRRKIDSKRIIALIFIIAALVMVAQG
ncbi:DMT family transporter [Klebsiella quasipneumoniae subsp. quasipneumoniae]|uniref:DMT family transporter n=1 Tax=Klebsiella quasipneumoniae TaxID=1463165 RepID=UPI0021763C2C|nr:DMT family transporter [Klebsiella quasipneumoniae]UWA87680.1 DMT family transporter [Klebsiella quasipneumoniae subsp. quasipneumoniae]